MLKNLLLKKMIKSQLKGVPEDQQEKILKVITENPELFQKIALEIRDEMKKGKEQMVATMEVMQRYQNELKGIM